MIIGIGLIIGIVAVFVVVFVIVIATSSTPSHKKGSSPSNKHKKQPDKHKKQPDKHKKQPKKPSALQKIGLVALKTPEAVTLDIEDIQITVKPKGALPSCLTSLGIQDQVPDIQHLIFYLLTGLTPTATPATIKFKSPPVHSCIPWSYWKDIYSLPSHEFKNQTITDCHDDETYKPLPLECQWIIGRIVEQAKAGGQFPFSHSESLPFPNSCCVNISSDPVNACDWRTNNDKFTVVLHYRDLNFGLNAPDLYKNAKAPFAEYLWVITVHMNESVVLYLTNQNQGSIDNSNPVYKQRNPPRKGWNVLIMPASNYQNFPGAPEACSSLFPPTSIGTVNFGELQMSVPGV